MNITLLQPNLHWHDPVANRAMLEEHIFSLPEPTDLIVLPEMFTTGFTMDARAVAEPMLLTTFRWLKQMAAQTKAVVTGSYVVQEDGNYYNRLIWMEPDGTFDTYDKRHLFRMAGEDQVYTAGTRRLVKDWKGWRICPLICYDLRFPVWSRNRGDAVALDANSPQVEYDVLLYVANWPSARRNAWNTLLQARAIENLSYVIGVNRVGEDGNGLPYAGESAVIDFKGDILFRHADSETVHQQTLSLDELRAFRNKFPAYLDADAFDIVTR
ncbi:Nitrilase/cyanide hydratase and apolipoprotein N-acyltransferase [Fibrisoma limi BUZ 3]|uniref:Omega-amidase YafV n=1 Tax=Fibrisoma limi BUZ 3 TaxID=1185876 RepID=I2GRC2_9BACT|nr:amidohydrolase [Fibrisoma limi]CCH56450.1 Nitrilase/cyanide hydratase and apolipoprotein N-acyltransferase [Fibrisoma limi BUZ 3]